MKTLLLCLALVLFNVNRSHAVVGLVVGAPVVAALGGVVAVGGLAGSILAESEYRRNNGRPEYQGVYLLVINAVTLPLGIILLDESQMGEMSFGRVSRLQNVDARELSIYNSELDELNAINQSIVAELSADPSLDSKTLWNDYGSNLKPETIKVAAILGQKMINNIQKGN